MKYDIRENSSGGYKEIFNTKTGLSVANNKRTNWDVEPNSKIGVKEALHVFKSIYRSHDLSWDNSGQKLINFLNSGKEMERPERYRDKDIEDVLIYQESTQTLRTSITNHMVACWNNGWVFDSLPDQFEDLSMKAFLVAHKTDFLASGDDMVNYVEKGAKIERNNENRELGV